MTKKERLEKEKQLLISMQNFEKPYRNQYGNLVAGVDEAGRGPLAGPVAAACVVLPADFDIPGINDSKKLSEKKREKYFDIIKENALAWAVGIRDSQVIDRINILEATKEAMRDAIAEADRQLEGKIDFVILDSVKLSGTGKETLSIDKGDEKSLQVAAASIIAKVTRDRMMRQSAEEYPGYGFEKNKGYGTREHCQGIEENGLTPIHRRSFCKKFI